MDFYKAKLSGNEDAYLGQFGADVSSQISGQLANARNQKKTAVEQLNKAIQELTALRNETSSKEKELRSQLQMAAKVVFANKSKARRKIEGLIAPDKAKEAKRMRFAFPIAIGIARGLGGSRFKRLRPAIKESFDLSFDMLGYIGGARRKLLRPTLAALKSTRRALLKFKIPNNVSNKKELEKLISNLDKTLQGVDRSIASLQRVIKTIKSDYLPKMNTTIQRIGSIFQKIKSPIEFIVKTLKEAPKTRERKKSRQNRKKKGSKKTAYRKHRDKRKILNKIRPKKRAQRANQVMKFYRPHKKFVNQGIKEARAVRNKLPGQLNQALAQMRQVRSTLKNISSTLKQAKSAF